MRVTTLKFSHRGKEEIKFTYEVNVSKDGRFYTTLSKEVVSKIEAYGVTMDMNRIGNRGYFTSDTMEGLERKIREAVEEAVSCEFVGMEDIIEYQLMICASYCRNGADKLDTKLYPNGTGLNGNYQWIEGNVRNDLLKKQPTSFSVYVKPKTIKRYKYKSGKERIETTNIDESKYPKESAILFLNSLVNIYPNNLMSIKKMPCTKENAEFFKKVIMSIWKLNEAIGKILKEDELEMAIGSHKLLTESKSEGGVL